MKKTDYYDVIVVGAGHAGVEAALAVARMNLDVLLVTINLDTIGLMPCNPSIGGPGKGHIAREIDALGGEMARNIDETHIHIRWLNTSKGPAVQALRAQADKLRYQSRLKHILESNNKIYLRQGMVTKLITQENYVKGIVIDTGERFYTGAIIATTGTFLNGIIHIGEKKFPAGRLGEFPAVGMTESLQELGIETGRLKTGTVARVNSKQIDFSRCIEQKPSSIPLAFSYFTTPAPRKQLSCWITHTTSETHDIIRSNFDRAPLFSGQIKGIGPRYCPSIEDKVNKFPDRDSHQIFLEPEGLGTNEIYMMGLSSSLPIDVQKAFINSIPGLENVDIMRPGYAIEYDFVFPTQLRPTLETKKIRNLYLAGQINGTSGYEEAAGQGIVSGVNAAASILGLRPLVIKRHEGYIGVLIDDLITKGTEEPYRIFTARAEYRLSMRFDNADTRLAMYGHEYGLISDEKFDFLNKRINIINSEIDNLEKYHVLNDAPSKFSAFVSKSLRHALKAPETTYGDLKDLNSSYPPVDDDDLTSRIQIEVKYEGYLKRQKKQIDEFKKYESISLPEDFDYDKVEGITVEARSKLKNIRPASVGQASRISGVSPADITVLIYFLRKASSR
ncbi:MAG TPA: tRNA uridine-5-carboxymethylaminomethyl(34) synthesis enzyme MnmG [bacterium]|nr:tRNA uridine-5-carboxymethylaminomethyl(34) synthesis enzyme MnmG [bacterium]